MRVPLRWLGESVDLPEDVTLEHVHAALVSVGFEEEDVHTFDLTGPIVVGRVLERVPEPQKNGKTINWCQVDVGEAEPRGIVCGAHNFDVGELVVVTLPGAVLPGPFPIAARKTYGHVSDGMIASARELGLGDEHDGILRFADLGMDPTVGADAIALLGLDDAAVEINVTPDRGYVLSMRGVAREYAHATGASFHDPVDRVAPRAAEGFRVAIDDQAPIRGRAGASTFVTRVVRGIDPTAKTPSWMVSRLSLAGVRSISSPSTSRTTSCSSSASRSTATTCRPSRAASACAGRPLARRSRPSTARSGSSTPKTSSSPTTTVPSASPASWAEPAPRSRRAPPTS